MLPACDLQAVMPERLQLPADLCQAHVLPRPELRSQVCRARSGVLRRSLCSGSCNLCRAVRPQVRSGSGPGVLRRSVRAGSGDLCRAVRSQVRAGSGDVCRSGSGELRRAVCSGSGQVLRQQQRVLREEVLC